MVRRKAHRRRVFRQIRNAQDVGVVDQDPQHSLADRQRPHRRPLVRSDPRVHELRQPTVGTAHTQRAVASIDDSDSDFDDPLEGFVEVESLPDDKHGLEQITQDRRIVDAVLTQDVEHLRNLALRHHVSFGLHARTNRAIDVGTAAGCTCRYDAWTFDVATPCTPDAP
ncbi:Uncharacterised protein [Mycobacteroides abscessus subsp. abscessus]|nr:Uncharacterised protein [Mycobacteroides abscessus subsp. abscessus]